MEEWCASPATFDTDNERWKCQKRTGFSGFRLIHDAMQAWRQPRQPKPQPLFRRRQAFLMAWLDLDTVERWKAVAWLGRRSMRWFHFVYILPMVEHFNQPMEGYERWQVKRTRWNGRLNGFRQETLTKPYCWIFLVIIWIIMAGCWRSIGITWSDAAKQNWTNRVLREVLDFRKSCWYCPNPATFGGQDADYREWSSNSTTFEILIENVKTHLFNFFTQGQQEPL